MPGGIGQQTAVTGGQWPGSVIGLPRHLVRRSPPVSGIARRAKSEGRSGNTGSRQSSLDTLHMLPEPFVFNTLKIYATCQSGQQGHKHLMLKN
ncbi:hypothetical protein JW979_14215 [bacterium]|nr:hypothetical protein [candidate division CSSED10-310 bacterium]